MTERIRYQGAILRDDHILLIKHRDHADRRAYWIIPGVGRENGESEEACVAREMRKETNLEIAVERRLLDEMTPVTGMGHPCKTYVCRIVSGEAKPGYEPEIEASQHYGIVEVRWFDLRHPETWDALLLGDDITFPLMQRIQGALGIKVKLGKQSRKI